MIVKNWNRTICGIALMALSGCAPPAPPPQPALPPAAQDKASSGPIALVAPPPAVPAKPAPAKRREDRKATAASAALPAPPPAHLVGMDETAVQALLGSPSTVEDHAPGKTWRFRKHECVLSVALYPDVQTRVFRTLSYEVTSDEHNAGAKQLCETKFGNLALAE